MDQTVVDDGAADLLVQLVQRLHLVHRNSQQPHAEKHLRPQQQTEENTKAEQAAAYLQQRDSSASSASSRKVRRLPARWRAHMSSTGSRLGEVFWKHRKAACRTASTTASTGNSAAQANSPSVRELLDACKSTPDQAEMRNGETGSKVAIGVRCRERTREFEERKESMGPRAGGEPSIDREHKASSSPFAGCWGDRTGSSRYASRRPEAGAVGELGIGWNAGIGRAGYPVALGPV